MEQTAEKRKQADGGMVIPCKSSEFIRSCLEVMRPIHKLSSREMDIAAIILGRRYVIAEDTQNKENIDKILFNKDTKKSIAAEAGITMDHFKIVLHKMRKNDVIRGNSFNPIYTPEWHPGKTFRWVFVFRNDN